MALLIVICTVLLSLIAGTANGCHFLMGCNDEMCSSSIRGWYLGNPGPGGWNEEIFVTPVKSPPTDSNGNFVIGPNTFKGYKQTLAGSLITAVDASSRPECCKACANQFGCSYYQFFPSKPTPAPPAGYVAGKECYLLSDAGIPLVPNKSWQKVLVGSKAGFSTSIVGGKCRPGRIIGEPHLVGALGTQFDFNGELDKSFCLVTDENFHINALLRGYVDNRTEGATLLSNGKALRTWMKQLGFVWKAADGRHTLRMVARDGKIQERGNGFLQLMEVDGQAIRLEVGQSFNGPAGLTVKFVGVEKMRRFEYDVYTVSVDDKLTAEVRLRIAFPALQTETEAYTHLDMHLLSVQMTQNVHGVLGQTFRDGEERLQRAVKYQAISRLLHANIQADGESGKGFLDGEVKDYETTTLLSTDCKFSSF
eukprot:TRINITY_DN10232_c0_g1_i1.p1 TRINITY_DN10232_c0_g1~~TRINITY_DN10232_c0_g1_i1.p1  ORF type:complete len:422 (+),score=63.72 TRINITY_DN10232_c0_g1_i1:122-1387(+)